MIRDILGFVLGLAFAAWILSFVVRGVRTRRIHHTDGTSTFSFRTQQVRFALVALLFVIIGGMLLYAAFGRAIAIWHRLEA